MKRAQPGRCGFVEPYTRLLLQKSPENARIG